MLILTENAKKAVGRFIKGADEPVAGLRISVTGGGCSGMQYAIALEEAANTNDLIVECGSFQVFVDPDSAPFLNGVEVDFQEGMDGSGFKLSNPNAVASCGCGKSFSA